MKNLYLFFQINIIAFKVLPVRHNALMPMFFAILETVRKVFIRMAFNTFFDSAFISSIESKRYPRSGFLSLLNSQKSHGAKSGEYGGCGTIWVEFLAKCFRRTSVFRTNQDLTRLRHKTSFKMVWVDPNEMPTASARSLIVNRRFSSTKFLISLT